MCAAPVTVLTHALLGLSSAALAGAGLRAASLAAPEGLARAADYSDGAFDAYRPIGDGASTPGRSSSGVAPGHTAAATAGVTRSGRSDR